ncbi:hypothetical protein BaOVIS_029620 [Babesia ovis]|uniref:Uncharacterized protein n=1 Tax=Babesia ovis TaxID=5869 RepID=A0A9W5WW27_BABOV|nr:hypothetical protein BaOVIS_029620 [Babesia ovis]
MGDDDPEAAYADFVLCEHQCVPVAQDSTASVSANVNSNKYYNEMKEAEKKRMLGIVMRLLLRRAPFPTRHDEVKAVLKGYLHDNTNHMVFNCFIEDAKKLFSKTLGLTLCDVKLPGGKRELFLKQSLAFHPHDHRINSEGDHELRGFLLLMLPCLKACTTGVPLDRLCDVFKRIGKGHMVPQNADEEESLKAALRSTRRKKEVKRHASDFKNIADYLSYARDLGYLNFSVDTSKGDNLAVISVHAGYRFALELDQESYIKQFNALEIEAPVKRSLGIFFES